MNQIIELPLDFIDHDQRENTTLSRVLNSHNFVVILGSPGSGKSKVLEKYELENSNCIRTTIKKFIRLNKEYDCEVLLLDGLDEFRITDSDKRFVIHSVAEKLEAIIKKQPTIKIVLACRELDWYGESDENALKEVIGSNLLLSRILPLDYKLKFEFVKKFGIVESQAFGFIEKFDQFGLLENPQILKMVVSVYLQNPLIEFKSKKEVYEAFFEQCLKEENQGHNDFSKKYSIEQKSKAVEYLAIYYFFTEIDAFDEDVIDDISNVENGFDKEILECVLKTKVFRSEDSKVIFSHRSIAEYSAGRFLAKLQIKQSSLNVNIKQVFFNLKSNLKIPSELRVVFAWYGTFSGDESMLEIDPYLQSLYSDVTILSNDEKIRLINAVKVHSESNPYFIKWGNSNNSELGALYNPELDDFLIEQFTNGILLKNHYLHYLNSIIINVKIGVISDKIKEFLQNFFEDKHVPYYYKRELVSIFDHVVLKGFLDKIIVDEIADDDDSLKESILNIIYPEHIDKISDYLSKYKTKTIGYNHFLLKTSDEKIESVLIELLSALDNEQVDIPYGITLLVNKYLEKLFVLYCNQNITAVDYYERCTKIMDIGREYTTLFDYMNVSSIVDLFKENEHQYERLSNEILEHFICNWLEKKEESPFTIFTKFKFLKLSDLDVRKSIIKHFNVDNTKDKNKLLFDWSFNKAYLNEISYDIIANQFGLELELQEKLKPLPWETDDKKREEEKEKKDREAFEKNEAFYSSQTDEQISKNFNALYFVAKFELFSKNDREKYISTPTYERVIDLIKKLTIDNVLLQEEYLTIESLANVPRGQHRAIDDLYYVSLLLNDYNVKRENIEFYKYLLMVAALRSNTINIARNLDRLYEQEELINSLKDFLRCQISFIADDVYKTIGSYFDQENDPKQLMDFVHFHSNADAFKFELLKKFILKYNFSITNITINEIKRISGAENSIEQMLNVLNIENSDLANFTLAHAILFREMARADDGLFEKLDQNKLVPLVKMLLNQFANEDELKWASGLVTPKQDCADFIQRVLLPKTEKEILIKVRNELGSNSIWKNRIQHLVSEFDSQEANDEYKRMSISEIKYYLFDVSEIPSNKVFFEFVKNNLQNLIIDIEKSRDNQKDLFYNGDNPKNEEACRDVFFYLFNLSYEHIVDYHREKPEGKNRVDVNLRYKRDMNFEVQIECKLDANNGINTGVSEQLVPKYLYNREGYGIYFIFFFGNKKDVKSLKEKIKNDVPDGYQDKIDIMFLDLRK